VIVRAALAGAGFGMSTFRIRHEFSFASFQFHLAQGVPARVAQLLRAVTGRTVAVDAAMRADAFAILAAQATHGKPKRSHVPYLIN
jgi:hypothetical protein